MPACPICNESLASERAKDLNKHNRKRLHFPCSVCGKGQSNAQKLTKHITSAHGPPALNPTTRCPICSTLVPHGKKESSRQKAIEAHNKQEGHFLCGSCDKKFGSAEARHMHSQALQHFGLWNFAQVPTSSMSRSTSTSMNPLAVVATEFQLNPVAQPALDSIVEERLSLVDKEMPLPTVVTSSSDIKSSSVSPNNQDLPSSSGLLADSSTIPQNSSDSMTPNADPPSLALEVESALPTLKPWYELLVPSQSHASQSAVGSDSENDSEVASYWDRPSTNHIGTPKPDESSEHPTHSFSKRSEVPPRLTRPSHPTGTDDERLEARAVPSTSGWVCRVCLEGPTDPVATMCGHVFCHSCITREISNNLQCPVCRKVILVRLHPLAP